MKKISCNELLQEGYIQEVNRLFFHPLGLALAATEDTSELHVIDVRDDPEGYYFGKVDKEKVISITERKKERIKARKDILGYYIQPVVGEEEGEEEPKPHN